MELMGTRTGRRYLLALARFEQGSDACPTPATKSAEIVINGNLSKLFQHKAEKCRVV